MPGIKLALFTNVLLLTEIYFNCKNVLSTKRNLYLMKVFVGKFMKSSQKDSIKVTLFKIGNTSTFTFWRQETSHNQQGKLRCAKTILNEIICFYKKLTGKLKRASVLHYSFCFQISYILPFVLWELLEFFTWSSSFAMLVKSFPMLSLFFAFS